MKIYLPLSVLVWFSDFTSAFPMSRSGYEVRGLPIFPTGEKGGLERRQTRSSISLGGNTIDIIPLSFAVTVNETQPDHPFDPQQFGAIGRSNGTSEEISFIHFDLPPADQINGVTEATECVAVVVPDLVLSNQGNSEIPAVLLFNLVAGQQLAKSSLTFNTRPSTDQLLTATTYGGDSGVDIVGLDQFVKQKCNFGGGMDFAARSIGENSLIRFSAASSVAGIAGAAIFVINP
jgi:hypothetical protein